MRRLRKNRYDSIWSKIDNEQSRRGKNYMDWRYLVQIIKQTTDDNLLTADTETLNITKIPNVDLPKWYTDDEKEKDALRQLTDSQLPPIEEMESHPLLMGDLTPLWKKRGTEEKETTIEEILKRWNLLQRLYLSLDAEKAASDVQFSNWFRLYRLVSGLIGLRHINYYSSSFEGCYYSRKPDTPWWIESKETENLMEHEDPILYMKGFVRENVKSFICEPSDYKELIMGWMTIKTIQAEKDNYLINHCDGRAISAYTKLEENYIRRKDDFHWGNVLCGYSYKKGVYPTYNNEDWKNKSHLDSPITSLPFIYHDRDNRDKNIIDEGTIRKGYSEVSTIISSFLKCLE